MKIILLSNVFPPEPVVSALTTASIAKALADHGHQVVVITSYPSRPAGKIYAGYKNRLFSKEKSPFGYEVVRCLSWPSPVSTFSSRFMENIVFGLSAAIYLLFIPKIDLIHSHAWPIFASGLVSLVARLRRTPYILQIVDLYPESIVSQKRLKPGSWPVKLMRAIDIWIAKGAQYITLITDHFYQVYVNDRKIPPEKLSVIPYWLTDEADCGDFDEGKSIRDQFGIAEDAFVAAYGGNIGVAAGVETFVKASALTEDVHVLIAGEGSELSACRELASRITPHKVSFFAPWPKEKTMPLYQAADVLVLPTLGEQSRASIPSKLIRYMLSGRAIIAAGLPGTELCNSMEKSGCGWMIPPDDPQSLSQAILEARNVGAAERSRRGAAGRDYALKNWTSGNNLARIIQIIENGSSSNDNSKPIQA